MENYPRDAEKLRKLADEGDPGAKWLLEKIERTEMARAMWMLSQVDNEKNRQAILDIADALLCYITDAKKETQKEEVDPYMSEVRSVYDNLTAVLNDIKDRIRSLVRNRKT